MPIAHIKVIGSLLYWRVPRTKEVKGPGDGADKMGAV